MNIQDNNQIMENIRKNVSALTLKIQSQKDIPLWALANEHLIYSIAAGIKPVWGHRSRTLRFFIAFSSKIKFTDIAVLLIGFYKLVSIWRIVKRGLSRKKELNNFKRVFVGFGAMPEEFLYKKFLTQHQSSLLRINQATYESMGELGLPSFLLAFNILIKHSIGFSSKLKKAIPEVSSNKIDFLLTYSLNIGVYAFFRSYWRMAKLNGLEEAIFLTPDIPTFACVDEEVNTIYFQHGLISLSILMPKVNRIITLTSDEESYLKGIFKDVQISKMTYGEIGIKKNILILLVHKDILKLSSSWSILQERLNDSDLLIQWAIKSGLQVVLWPTPNIAKDDLTDLHRRFANTLLDDLNKSMDESLNNWAPKFVASWTSTGLAIALNYGCIPISLSNPAEVHSRWSTIYPMKNRVLFWSRDEALILATLKSESVYRDQLMNLYKQKDQLLTLIEKVEV